MKFSVLASYFEKLEGTSSRIELTKILSGLFKNLSPEEIDKVCYLLQGRVVPFFEPIEIGMADRMVEQVLAIAYDASREEVRKLAVQTGDMGLVAGRLNPKSEIRNSKLSVSDVYDSLYKIATTGGEGSVEKKISTLANLLKNLDAKSTKHLIRVTLAKLRLGIGDPTVLDALSVAKLGDKSARFSLEEAYNKTSDLGFVAKTFWSFDSAQDALNAVEKTRLQVGKPVRPALAERLPDAVSVIKKVGNLFAAEPKYDGFRCQVHLQKSKVKSKQSLRSNELQKAKVEEQKEVRIFSRNLEDFTHAFPDLVEAVKKEVKAESAIFEGEAIAFNPVTGEYYPFQETTKRRRKYDIEKTAKKLPLKLFVFDLLYLNGSDLTKDSYKDRRNKLLTIISKDNKIVRLSEEYVLHSEKDIEDKFSEAVTSGLEGLMIKKLDSPYKAGARGFHWIKFKRAASGQLSDTIDTVLLGIYIGTGKRTEFGAGGLLVGVYDTEKDEFVTVSRVGTGLTDEEWRKVYGISQRIQVDHKPARVNALIEPSYWVEPKEVLEILADEITRSPVHTAGKIGDNPGYALRFPRLISFRGTDKRAEDATTVKELISMYKQQRKIKL